jgi:hypothetical protein
MTSTIPVPRKSNGKIDWSSSDLSLQLLKHLRQALLNNDGDIVLKTMNRDEFLGAPGSATLKLDEEVDGKYYEESRLWIRFDYETETIDEIHYWYGPSDENVKYYFMRPRFTCKLVRIGAIEIYFYKKVGLVISKRGLYWWPEDTEETPLDALRRVTLRF